MAAEVRDAHERVLASTGVGAGPSVTVEDRGLLNACKARARTAGAHGPEGGLCSQALQAARTQSVAAALKAGANPKLGLSYMFKLVGLIDPEPAAENFIFTGRVVWSGKTVLGAVFKNFNSWTTRPGIIDFIE